MRFQDAVYDLGGLLDGIPFQRNSQVFFVDATNGTAAGDGSFLSPLLTIQQALALCTSGRHDTVALIASAGKTAELTKIAWNKNLTHLVGLGAPIMVSQRSRVGCGAVDVGGTMSPYFIISAYGCIFRNIQIAQEQADATTLLNVSVTGDRNYFKNVHFAGGLTTEQAIDGGASLYINAGSENLFEDCTIGADTIDFATGMACLVFASTAEANRNIFRRCHFTMHSGSASAIFVEVLSGDGIGRYTVFDDCLFLNTGTALTQAFAIVNVDVTHKKFFLKNCALYGAPKWDNADRNLLFGDMGTPTGLDLSGVMLALEG